MSALAHILASNSNPNSTPEFSPGPIEVRMRSLNLPETRYKIGSTASQRSVADSKNAGFTVFENVEDFMSRLYDARLSLVHNMADIRQNLTHFQEEFFQPIITSFECIAAKDPSLSSASDKSVATEDNTGAPTEKSACQWRYVLAPQKGGARKAKPVKIDPVLFHGLETSNENPWAECKDESMSRLLRKIRKMLQEGLSSEENFPVPFQEVDLAHAGSASAGQQAEKWNVQIDRYENLSGTPQEYKAHWYKQHAAALLLDLESSFCTSELQVQHRVGAALSPLYLAIPGTETYSDQFLPHPKYFMMAPSKEYGPKPDFAMCLRQSPSVGPWGCVPPIVMAGEAKVDRTVPPSSTAQESSPAAEIASEKKKQKQKPKDDSQIAAEVIHEAADPNEEAADSTKADYQAQLQAAFYPALTLLLAIVDEVRYLRDPLVDRSLGVLETSEKIPEDFFISGHYFDQNKVTFYAHVPYYGQKTANGDDKWKFAQVNLGTFLLPPPIETRPPGPPGPWDFIRAALLVSLLRAALAGLAQAICVSKVFLNEVYNKAWLIIKKEIDKQQELDAAFSAVTAAEKAVPRAQTSADNAKAALARATSDEDAKSKKKTKAACDARLKEANTRLQAAIKHRKEVFAAYETWQEEHAKMRESMRSQKVNPEQEGETLASVAVETSKDGATARKENDGAGRTSSTSHESSRGQPRQLEDPSGSSTPTGAMERTTPAGPAQSRVTRSQSGQQAARKSTKKK